MVRCKGYFYQSRDPVQKEEGCSPKRKTEGVPPALGESELLARNWDKGIRGRQGLRSNCGSEVR